MIKCLEIHNGQHYINRNLTETMPYPSRSTRQWRSKIFCALPQTFEWRPPSPLPNPSSPISEKLNKKRLPQSLVFGFKKVTTLLGLDNCSDSPKIFENSIECVRIAPEIFVFRRKCYFKTGFGPHSICQVYP